MAISYPLTPPATPGNRAIAWLPRSVVGVNISPFTGAQQTYQWPGEWWEVTVTLPAMKDATAGPWRAFLLALRSRSGTFYFGDSVRKTPLGTIAGAWTVGAGATLHSTTLPLATVSGTGTFAVGDWLQVGTGSSSRLHQVTQVNAGSVDVFPFLRTAYANGTAIAYSGPKGVFRLAAPVPWEFDARRIERGISFSAMEVVP